MSEQYLLSICIPTYNRKHVIVPDVKRYLSINDYRFCVKISDNCSDDGTKEELMSINDSRLIYNFNNYNYGGISNAFHALHKSPSKYLLYVLDKDTVDEKLLSRFLDYLEDKSPYYGYVDLSNNLPFHETIYKAGRDAILHTAFLSKHPSGFFWRKDLYDEESEKDYYQSIYKTFDFQFDLMAGFLGAKYDATIFYWPLIINANLRVTSSSKPEKTLTYCEKNIFFGKEKRILAYKHYMDCVKSIQLNVADKSDISKQLTFKCIGQVTTELRYLYNHKDICFHYNITPRKVSFTEMIENLGDVLAIYVRDTKVSNSFINLILFSSIIATKSFLRISFQCLKDCFVTTEKKTISA